MVSETRIAAALALAKELHAGQLRKGTSLPYVSHPMAVAELVASYGGTENEQIAALLHDTVEDCGGAPVLERIAAEYGAEVAEIVAGCTQNGALSWEERKLEYLEHLAKASASVRLVAACDKLHNASCIVSDLEAGEAVWEKLHGGKAKSIWYYEKLSRALLGTPPGAALAATVAKLSK